jgi:hypothetical protein
LPFAGKFEAGDWFAGDYLHHHAFFEEVPPV